MCYYNRKIAFDPFFAIGFEKAVLDAEVLLDFTKDELDYGWISPVETRLIASQVDLKEDEISILDNLESYERFLIYNQKKETDFDSSFNFRLFCLYYLLTRKAYKTPDDVVVASRNFTSAEWRLLFYRISPHMFPSKFQRFNNVYRCHRGSMAGYFKRACWNLMCELELDCKMGKEKNRTKVPFHCFCENFIGVDEFAEKNNAKIMNFEIIAVSLDKAERKRKQIRFENESREGDNGASGSDVQE